MPGYILALDQGTTSSRAILFDDRQNIRAIAQKGRIFSLLPKLYPGAVSIKLTPAFGASLIVSTTV